MAWFLSPSGWPTTATVGSLAADALLADGYQPIEETQVADALAAYTTGGPPPTSYGYVTQAGLPARVTDRVNSGDFQPAGTWDFTTAPTVAGSPLGAGGAGSITDNGDGTFTITL